MWNFALLKGSCGVCVSFRESILDTLFVHVDIPLTIPLDMYHFSLVTIMWQTIHPNCDAVTKGLSGLPKSLSVQSHWELFKSIML